MKIGHSASGSIKRIRQRTADTGPSLRMSPSPVGLMLYFVDALKQGVKMVF
jgi:hypothetical protein